MLIDSSAWIEYLREHTGSLTDQVARVLDDGTAATCDTVLLELVCGPTSEARAEEVDALLARCRQLEQVDYADVWSAGEIYRGCRRAGETLRAANDCLIAAVAIRHNVPVLHRDRDYDVIARHTALQVVAVP